MAKIRHFDSLGTVFRHICSDTWNLARGSGPLPRAKFKLYLVTCPPIFGPLLKKYRHGSASRRLAGNNRIGHNTKDDARRSPNSTRKTKKYVFVERRYLSRYRNSVKNCFLTLTHAHTKFHWNQAIGFWVMAKKWFFLMAIRHLEFWKFSYLVIWLSSSSKYAVVYPVSSIGWFFVEIWPFHDFQDGVSPPSWIFGIQ